MTRWVIGNISIGHRIAITFIAVIVILLALALYGYLTGAWEDDTSGEVMTFALTSAETRIVILHGTPAQAQEKEPEIACVDTEMREKIREIMLTSLNDALHDHIVNVFGVWLRDDSGQPGRARKGVKQGISAYIRSRKGVENWNPPECRTQ